ncbi:uncharacterized protein B0H18DRAFT_177905 [Fomitopsis serialis]|uniref:uncharacterized protein n=1 Tax=Fomitopsis serialis TaxID=139415 RepID=UPI002008A67A|nr:uncharacterized protein B0H18DRAFT_177905 [Neoantrodia serialis]KAH9913291.1 hypothetical protein B0H18DRAFT_177905 [Neoantrodia serialis]
MRQPRGKWKAVGRKRRPIGGRVVTGSRLVAWDRGSGSSWLRVRGLKSTRGGRTRRWARRGLGWRNTQRVRRRAPRAGIPDACSAEKPPRPPQRPPYFIFDSSLRLPVSPSTHFHFGLPVGPRPGRSVHRSSGPRGSGPAARCRHSPSPAHRLLLAGAHRICSSHVSVSRNPPPPLAFVALPSAFDVTRARRVRFAYTYGLVRCMFRADLPINPPCVPPAASCCSPSRWQHPRSRKPVSFRTSPPGLYHIPPLHFPQTCLILLARTSYRQPRLLWAPTGPLRP